MNDTNLSSRYLFNEIPDEQKTIDEFGCKACNLSLAKKWQFPVPDTILLSGGLVKEIFEKKRVPAEILSHFKNKLLAIRPSPVIDLSAKNEPFLYIGPILTSSTLKLFSWPLSGQTILLLIPVSYTHLRAHET